MGYSLLTSITNKRKNRLMAPKLRKRTMISATSPRSVRRLTNTMNPDTDRPSSTISITSLLVPVVSMLTSETETQAATNSTKDKTCKQRRPFLTNLFLNARGNTTHHDRDSDAQLHDALPELHQRQARVRPVDFLSAHHFHVFLSIACSSFSFHSLLHACRTTVTCIDAVYI